MPRSHSRRAMFHRRLRLLTATAVAGLVVPAVAVGQTTVPAAAQAGSGPVGRSVAETHAPAWPANPAAPKGAPNVIVILTDDVGFGVTSTFGGPVPTPAFDALSREGLRYNRFNTTALCSPTRASLLTGRMPHNVNMGNVTNLPTGYDGYTTVIPKSAGTVAEILKENGYNTAMFGKNHMTPDWEMSPAGPFDRWPTGLGFEYFYGFMSADTSMWAPSITENTLPVEPPHNDPGYFFEKDMADHAIRWMNTQKAAAPDKPFFMYYAPGLSHTPHHAPQEWIARFKGQFDQGWDKLREQTFARQKRMGIIPANAQLSPRPASLPAWDSLSAEQRRVYARLMEVYAATIAYSDDQTGRLINAVKASGQFDNTLIVYIEGDNGSSAEGGLNGLSYEQSAITGRKESFAELAANIDRFGGPDLYNHFPAAWAWAMNAPFPYWKQVASQAGGVRNGMVVSWPNRITDKGGLRSQYAHVSDIMPTVLEAAGVVAPDMIGGVRQKPIDGISLAYSFTAPGAPSARRQQVYELMENFGIYKDGWMAGTLPKRTAWEVGVGDNRKADLGPDGRVWTLFNLDRDFTTAQDLSKQNPAKLKELQDLFWAEAARNNILPIHDYGQGAEGRPSLGRHRKQFVYPAGIATINEDAAPRTIGHSFRIEADVTIPASGASGVMIAQGGQFGGYSFYLQDGRPVFHYNAIGTDQSRVAADAALAPGGHVLAADFAIDGPGLRAGGMMTLSVDGKTVATGRISQTLAQWMSHTEGLDIGLDPITPVSRDYTSPTSAFTGTIREVRVTVRD